MDPQKITELANLLRNSGDKVLNSEFKLTLTGSLLRALNDSFTLIADSTELATKQSFQVVKPNNSKSNVFRDLQLVHDFVQKTIHLCITHYPGDDYFDGVIDLSKFRSLKRLEVQRTNIKQIVGIQPLRSQLQQLVCVRSLQSVVEIITHCGGDRSNGFVWNELKTADFSYNNLNTIDSSLEFAQYLQHLNLRHNQLVSVEAIKWLPNLKTLDLSYNRLTMVPNFHVETTKRLQCLNLSNNFLEDLIGVSKLDLLTELDLSNNCLLDHNALYPLSALVTLKYLNLYGNPLYYHPKHRLATAQFLHKDTCTVKFILNCESLTKSEKVLTGTHQHNNHCGYVVKYMANSNSRPTPCKDPSLNQTPASSEGSKKNYKSFAIADDEGVGMTSSITEKSKRVKVRQVVIECPEQINNGTVALTESENTTTNLKINKDHLETKKQFNILRNKYGAGWLQNENAHIVDNVLGLSPSNTTTVNSDTKITPHQILYDYLGEISSTDLNVNTNAIVKKTTYVNLLEEISSDSLSKNADVSEYISAFSNISNDVENKKPVYLTDEEQEVAEPLDIAPHLENIYYVNTVDELELSDPETDEETFIVYTLEKKEPILLTVSPNCIREKDASNHKSIMTKAKWSLKILESCDRIKSNMLRINFDTVKMDKKERVYTIEEQSCQELEKKLRAILSKRNLFEMNQKVYRCINCNCQFSKENSLNNHRKQGVFCPDCKSTFVTEIHNLPPSLNKTSTTTPKFVQEIAVEVINMEIKKKESPMFSISSTHEEKRDSMGEPDNSMHGSDGLLQSTNMLMSRTTQRFVESELSSLQCEKYNFNYTDFSDVDHRLKFYFYQMKFEEQSEHFKWIVKGKLYNENTGTIIDGIVVMSTLKCYVMEEFGPENDNVSKWLRPVVSVTADRLESIRLLPWKVGISFALRDWGNFLLLLQDILRTDSLLFYFTTNALPDQCKLDYTISEKVLNRLANTVENEKLNMFSLLNSCEVNLHDKVETFIMPGLFTTNSRLFLSATNPSWLTPTTDVAIEVGLTQFMSNLVEVERPEENIFSLHFHDETKNITELWKCRFETKENAESCLNAIGQSWEKLFGVSLFNN
ncbi:serine/threonine-protein kinase 11-interacting protein isoform X4 [Episyrphus balteatus]|uniref:serine/threonine-protein kinase 11-interacting protein isoform X4 n=1 Tax=Episyrphus balteatus TaxID=286459 RepID=UPI0024854928|nr:serine/threonine-protein kinase 11-interacting protein isoform X4 [Episyrphus balteatus]